MCIFLARLLRVLNMGLYCNSPRKSKVQPFPNSFIYKVYIYFLCRPSSREVVFCGRWLSKLELNSKLVYQDEKNHLHQCNNILFIIEISGLAWISNTLAPWSGLDGGASQFEGGWIKPTSSALLSLGSVTQTCISYFYSPQQAELHRVHAQQLLCDTHS